MADQKRVRSSAPYHTSEDLQKCIEGLHSLGGGWPMRLALIAIKGITIIDRGRAFIATLRNKGVATNVVVTHPTRSVPEADLMRELNREFARDSANWCRLPAGQHVTLDEMHLPWEFGNQILTLSTCLDYHLVAFGIHNENLLIAATGQVPAHLEEIENNTGLPVIVYLASSEDIDAAIRVQYGSHVRTGEPTDSLDGHKEPAQ